MRKKEKAMYGQRLCSESSPDNASSFKANNNEALMGPKTGGGPRDVSHSLSGAGSVVDYQSGGKGSKKSKGKMDY